MLEASTRPAMVPGWWLRRPAWSPYAATGWSVLYGALALSWAVSAPGFPFGAGAPEGAAMGSVLFAIPAEPTGLVMSGWCAAGEVVAGAMRRPTSHLAIATSAYYHRRRGRDRAAARFRRRHGTPC